MRWTTQNTKKPATLCPVAELEKSPEHIHTYRLSDLVVERRGRRNDGEANGGVLIKHKFPLPSNLSVDIAERLAGTAGSN